MDKWEDWRERWPYGDVLEWDLEERRETDRRSPWTLLLRDRMLLSLLCWCKLFLPSLSLSLSRSSSGKSP